MSYYWLKRPENKSKRTVPTVFSAAWKPGDEPYYPVNDQKNTALYEGYRAIAQQEPKITFGGRLGEYKYYDMDQVIAAALNKADGMLG